MEGPVGFGRLKISARVFAGFGLLIVLSLVIAGFSIYQLSGISSQTTKMTTVAENRGRVLNAKVGLEAMRRAETRMRLDGEGGDDTKSNIAGVRELMEQAEKASLSQERRSVDAAVLDMLRTHEEQFGSFRSTDKIDGRGFPRIVNPW